MSLRIRHTTGAILGGLAVAAVAGPVALSALSATKAPIVVMTVSADNNNNYNLPDVWDVANAFASSVNAKGGLNGHPLKVIDCNDQANPNLAQGCARQAVSEHVVALVGGLTTFRDQMWPILEANHIPWVGNNPLGGGDFTSPMSFPIANTPLQYLAAGALIGRQCKRPAAMIVDNAANRGQLQNFAVPGVKSQGKSFVSVTYVPLTATDYTPLVAQVLASNPDCVYLGGVLTFLQQAFHAFEASNTKARIFPSASTSFDLSVVAAAPRITEGALIPASFPVSTAPAWKAYNAAITKYADPSKIHPNVNQLNTWVAYTVFANAISRIGASVSSGKLVGVLTRAKKIDTHGLTKTLNFTKPGPIPGLPRLFNTSITYWKVKNGQIVGTSNRFFDMAPNYLRGTR